MVSRLEPLTSPRFQKPCSISFAAFLQKMTQTIETHGFVADLHSSTLSQAAVSNLPYSVHLVISLLYLLRWTIKPFRVIWVAELLCPGMHEHAFSWQQLSWSTNTHWKDEHGPTSTSWVLLKETTIKFQSQLNAGRNFFETRRYFSKITGNSADTAVNFLRTAIAPLS